MHAFLLPSTTSPLLPSSIPVNAEAAPGSPWLCAQPQLVPVPRRGDAAPRPQPVDAPLVPTSKEKGAWALLRGFSSRDRALSLLRVGRKVMEGVPVAARGFSLPPPFLGREKGGAV